MSGSDIFKIGHEVPKSGKNLCIQCAHVYSPMKKTSAKLPFWAKVVFETPELLTEIMIAFRKSIKNWNKVIHARSRWLDSIDETNNMLIDKELVMLELENSIE
jgi:hypothetical protein